MKPPRAKGASFGARPRKRIAWGARGRRPRPAGPSAGSESRFFLAPAGWARPAPSFEGIPGGGSFSLASSFGGQFRPHSRTAPGPRLRPGPSRAAVRLATPPHPTGACPWTGLFFYLLLPPVPASPARRRKIGLPGLWSKQPSSQAGRRRGRGRARGPSRLAAARWIRPGTNAHPCGPGWGICGPRQLTRVTLRRPCVVPAKPLRSKGFTMGSGKTKARCANSTSGHHGWPVLIA